MDELYSQDSKAYARLLIGRARHILSRARHKELASTHISPRQATALFLIDKLGKNATLTELAKHSDRGITTLSMQLTRMTKNGLVKKVRVSTNSTLLRFEMTEKGRNIYKFSKEYRSNEEIMSILSEKERQNLIATLKKIISCAEKYTDGTSQSKA